MAAPGRQNLEDLLRRLSLSDEKVVRRAVGPQPGGPSAVVALDERTRSLVRLAAILTVGAPTSSCRVCADRARRAGASDDEIVDVLIAVAPAIGEARLVEAAPRLAMAIDIDVGTIDDPGLG